MKNNNTIKIQNLKYQRKGQFIFNFLEWLRAEKGVSGNQNNRLADTFHLSNEEFDAYLKEYQNDY